MILRVFYALVKRVVSLIKLSIAKLCNPTKLSFGLNESLSLLTIVRVYDGGRIKLGNKIHTNGRVEITASHGGKITIGEGCYFNAKTMIISKDEIEIGEGCMFGPNTMLFDHDHIFKREAGLRGGGYVKAPIKIGNGVWCGSNVTILKGVTIGDNSVIAAGTLVKEDVPPDTLYYEERHYKMKKIDRSGTKK